MRVFDPCRVRPILFLLALIIFSTAALANDYYVSSSGSGTACTKSSPCSVSQGFANYPNNTSAIIHFADGLYSSGMDVTKNGASASSRLVLQCDNGLGSALAAAGHCRFTNAITVALNAVGGNNIDIVGFDLGNNPNMPYAFDVISDVSGNAANSVHLIGNYIHDLASNVPDANPPNTLGCPLNGAIQGNNAEHHMSGLKIIGNFIKNFGGGYPLANCNHGQGIYTESAGVVIQNNILVNIPVGGIVIRENCGNVVSNNVVIAAKHGIILNNSNTSDCPDGLNGHNTFNNNYFAVGYNSTSPGYGVFFVSSASICTGSTPNYWGHNMRSGLETGDFSAGRASCDQVAPSAFVQQAGSSFFVNYQTNGTGDYHLRASSAGIAAGSTACTSGGANPCTPSTDFNGTARLPALSVGPFEFARSSSLPNAPTGLQATVQ